MIKALVSAVFAAVILIAGADGFSQAWAGSRGGPVKAGWGHPGGWPAKGGWGRPGWHGRGWYGPRVWWGVGVAGPAFWWGARPWWGPGWYGYPAYPYGYYPYAYPPYAYPPTAVVQPTPQTYIEQAPPATGPAQTPTYWYYCAESRTYYPYVRECPEGWMTVVPPASSPSP
jgi:hypothetical protein